MDFFMKTILEWMHNFRRILMKNVILEITAFKGMYERHFLECSCAFSENSCCYFTFNNVLDRIFVTRNSCNLAKIVQLFKGAPSSLGQFLANESPLKMKKNAFYFNSKALSVLKIFKILP